MDLDVLQHYQTGVSAMDTQHRELFMLLNGVLDMLEDKAKCVMLIKQYIDATEEHFGKEEAYMREIDYPYIAPHLIEHARLLAAVKAFAYDMQVRQPATLERYSIHALTRELLSHIDYYDIQIGVYAQRKKEG